MKKRFFSLIIAALMVMPCTAYAAEDSSAVVFKVTEENEPVCNPHKGWVQYLYDNWQFDDPVYGTENNPTWDYVSTVYSRFLWCDIEPEKGKYDWSKIDEMIERSDKLGKSFAFGIIPSDSGYDRPQGLVPEYVYNDGCKYVTAATSSFYSEDGYQRTPVWSDKIYHEAAIRLAEAIAEKYDGDERVEYIDIRSLGNWGEWHTYGLEGSEMPSEEIQKQYIREWSEIFEKTQLVLPVNDDKPSGVSKYAVTLGVTLRRDGLVGLENHEKALAPAFDAGLPAVGETCYGYKNMRDNGTWTDDKLAKAVRGGRVTYMALAGSIDDGFAMDNERRKIVHQLQNEIGYNFVVTYASVSFSGDKAKITLKVKNKGIAPQYFPMNIAFAVTDKNGNDPQKFEQSFFCESGSFASGKTKTYTYTVPADKFKSGDYLSVGIFEDNESDAPTVRFCNKNTAKNNYLVLGEVVVSE